MDSRIIELLGIAFGAHPEARRKAADFLIAIIQHGHGSIQVEIAERWDPAIAEELRQLACEMRLAHLLES